MLHEEAAELNCSLDRENCLLSLNFAEKIPLREIHHAVGGNAANAAVGGARLGMETAIMSIVGNDDASKRAICKFENENVSLDYLTRDKITNQSIALVYKGERTILVHHEPRRYIFKVDRGTQWIYLTSMGRGGEEIVHDVAQYTEAHNASIVFSPGTYQLKLGPRPYGIILQSAHTIILNKEEAIQYTRGTDKEDIKDLLDKLLALGPERAVITDGERGSYASDGEQYWHCQVFPAERIEATGAGDAYASAFAAAMFYGLSIDDAMRWGSINSASVIGRIGPQGGLLNKMQLEHRSTNHTNFRAQPLREVK